MSAIPCAVLMCHAPIVIPEVGGSRAAECAATTEAMRRAAERLLACAPDVLVIVSPHAPRHPNRWGLAEGQYLQGDFGDFGVPHVGLRLPVAGGAIHRIRQAAEHLDVPTSTLPSPRLDHGAMVPLHFAVEAGWSGPTVLLGLPFPGTGTEARMGQAIGRAAASSGEKWAFLASGDMSHRLIPGAPAGHHPRAADFDAAFTARIREGDLRGATSIDPALRDIAAEDVVDSVAVAAGAIGWETRGHEVLSYEGPFGVGYLEAVLYDEQAG